MSIEKLKSQRWNVIDFFGRKFAEILQLPDKGFVVRSTDFEVDCESMDAALAVCGEFCPYDDKEFSDD